MILIKIMISLSVLIALCYCGRARENYFVEIIWFSVLYIVENGKTDNPKWNNPWLPRDIEFHSFCVLMYLVMDFQLIANFDFISGSCTKYNINIIKSSFIHFFFEYYKRLLSSSYLFVHHWKAKERSRNTIIK